MEWVFVILVTIAIYAAIFYYRKKVNGQLEAEGKIIERKGAFYENAQIFTTKATYEEIRDIMAKRDFSEMKAAVYPDLDGKREIFFKSDYAWNAALTQMQPAGDKNVFRFGFTAWKEKNYSPYNPNSMNMMMTAVEKTILSLDPGATVEEHKMQLNSKTKIL